MADFWATDISWRAIEGAPDDVGETQGRAALLCLLPRLDRQFDDISNVPEEIRDAGDDRALTDSASPVERRRAGCERRFATQLSTPCATGKSPAGAST